ncbi:MAG: V-type ATP synthase subunit A [Candidatus Omnitrophica bacterium]|nr:V-type ATP synthase subunit A [Candidatus Omnitrophota bacterium]MCF7877937.1 V-type ATP synthase subunit A [Candidatus Omnitrophota bacterium]MCF7893400.1 V-type ATP synthase subunit A [Candidatus Omnitrophota bacterium]
MKKSGKITAISGNMITVEFADSISQNEVGYVIAGQQRLKSEVIRINQNTASMQVFEDTKGIKVGDKIEFSGEMISVELGPGLLGQVYDGLQNPLHDLAKEFGVFLPRGKQLEAVGSGKKWHFKPQKNIEGKKVSAGQPLGYVEEGIFKHFIFVPFSAKGDLTVKKISSEGDYKVKDKIAVLEDQAGAEIEVTMIITWPVKVPISAYTQKFTPQESLATKMRILDTFFPVAKGGTYCIPGPFGSGKTVLQQLISRYADVDVVILAACGERAGEVVETLKEFPKLEDPRTGRSLMERTIVICNTSSMPVAARDASVYTAATLGEYYRQMGLNVLLLADSTSRWAQAMREISGRLEEIPGEEAYPAYLESRIAEFYERAGHVKLPFDKKGSLTIGGTVSPAGGNFDEPVTQSTLKVVGAFHGLSRDRANARKYPSVDPLQSWSRYQTPLNKDKVEKARNVLKKGDEVDQMMKVVGEEGTSLDDYQVYLKSDFLDAVYLQQNGFNPIDAATGIERQAYVFDKISFILDTKFKFSDKDQARKMFYKLRSLFIDWNYTEKGSEKYKNSEKEIDQFLSSQKQKEEEK